MPRFFETAKTFSHNMLTRHWPYLVLLLLSCLYYFDILFSGDLYYMRDAFCQGLPSRQFLAQCYNSGILPLWNPYNSFGSPFAADPINPLFYPPSLLINIGLPFWGWRLTYLVHTWLASSTMFALGKRWGLNTGPALLMGTCFGFGTWMSAYTEHAGVFWSAAWAPLLFILIDQAINNASAHQSFRKKIKSNLLLAGLLTLVFSIQYAACYPECFLYVFMLLMAYLIARLFYQRDLRTLFSIFVIVFIAGILTIVIVSPQLVMTIEYLPFSERQTSIDPGYERSSLHPYGWLGFAFPFIFGTPGYPNHFWQRTIFEYWLCASYIGILPLLLIPFGALFLRKGEGAGTLHRFHTLLFFGIIIIMLIYAGGQYTGLHSILYKNLPIFDRFRWPTKSLLVVYFSMSILAALGLQAFLARKNELWERAKLRLGASLFAILIISIGFLLYARNNPEWVTWIVDYKQNQQPHQLITYFPVSYDMLIKAFDSAIFGIALGLGSILAVFCFYRIKKISAFVAPLVIILAFLDMAYAAKIIRPAFDEKYSVLDENPILEHVAKNKNGRILSMFSETQFWFYGNEDPKLFHWGLNAGVGDTWLPKGVYKVWSGNLKFDRDNYIQHVMTHGPADVAGRLADMASVEFILAGKTRNEDVFSILKREIPQTRWLQRTTMLPRAYMINQWSTVQGREASWATITGKSFDAHRAAVIELDGKTPPPDAAPPRICTITNVSNFKDDWNTVSMNVTANNKELLILNDNWYPGWHAFVDGKEQPIHLTNFIFRGVFIDPGTHHVEFVYKPTRFYNALAASLLGMCIAAALIIAGRRIRKSVSPIAAETLAMQSSQH